MKLILDTNILISALLKDATVRRILVNPHIEFFLPEFSLEEINKHLDIIVERSNLTEKEVHLTLSLLLTNINVVPSEQIIRKYAEAEQIMERIDRDDVPFLALALTLQNDGIWTEDKHFQKQSKIKVWKTADLVSTLNAETQ